MNSSPQVIFESYQRGELDKSTTVGSLLTLTTESKRRETRIESLEILGRIGLRGEVDEFIALEILLLSDEDRTVRKIAARILMNNFPIQAMKPIKWALRHEPDFECAIEIIELLSDINTKEARIMLEKRLLEVIYTRSQSRRQHESIGVFQDSFEKALEGKDIGDLDLKEIAQILINFKTIDVLTKKLGITPIELENSKVVTLDLKNKNIRESAKIEPLKNLKMLRTLNLNNNYLLSLPETFCSITSLQALNLSLNQLSNLPESIENFRELRTLDVSNNDLRILPDTIGNLVNLQRLDLSNNHMIRTLPESIGRLGSLTLLDLSNNRIEELPDSIGDLASLEYLDLSGNQIEELPDSIDTLTNLKVFNLENNRLKSLPKSIGGLASIQALYLGSNHLSTIPESIGDLTTLQRLDLHNNELKMLPRSISKLASLYMLEAYYNEIEEIPQSIENMMALQLLDLRHNRLNSFPRFVESLTSLKMFLVRGNPLSPKNRSESANILKRLVDKGVGIFE
ncbi:MAG: leucine-rich repeat domain-containing protein [Candidatus Lokiarchaeota archaeon]|nr:leucine-rich repeat domain-containing protein [Candidatus Lokiarchaeota archaeon]